eukprot:1125450-Alexandrium_andersonii.AAC.1
MLSYCYCFVSVRLCLALAIAPPPHSRVQHVRACAGSWELRFRAGAESQALSGHALDRSCRLQEGMPGEGGIALPATAGGSLPQAIHQLVAKHVAG